MNHLKKQTNFVLFNFIIFIYSSIESTNNFSNDSSNMEYSKLAGLLAKHHHEVKVNTTSKPTENKLAEWSILTYMEANNDLCWWSNYSISHMIAGIQNINNINILVQLDRPNSKNIMRLKIIPNNKEVDSLIAKKENHNHVELLIDSMNWVKNKYPAKKYILVFWDHGTGILDYQLKKNKGILLNYKNKTIFTNQDLLYALKKITNILGQKIEIIIMDACYMQMIEIAYQIKNYANYLVGSQEYETYEGVPYSTFLYPMTLSNGLISSIDLIKHIVDGYGTFYKNKEGYQQYTFSALDLNLVNKINENINKLIAQINIIKGYDTNKAIKNARLKSQEFWSDFIDIFSFYTNLENELNTTSEHNSNLEDLKKIIIEGKELIKSIIIANTNGTKNNSAYGLSIYYPITHSIHKSYPKTLFAQQTEWLNFIKKFQNHLTENEKN